MNKIENLKPFPKFCCSIGYIPTSYKVSMTYEEQLFWLCDFLKNTVIPTVNQNGQAVEELQNLYIELKSYVDNYFENLDVQEEINNKLDEMAQDGTLANIINNEIFEELNEKVSLIPKIRKFANYFFGVYFNRNTLKMDYFTSLNGIEWAKQNIINNLPNGRDPSLIYVKELKKFIITYSSASSTTTFNIGISSDLINWEWKSIYISGYNSERRCWAPDLLYKDGKLYVTFSVKNISDDNMQVYLTSTTDLETFNNWTPPEKLALGLDYVIDSQIKFVNGLYYLICKNGTNENVVDPIKIFTSDNLINWNIYNSSLINAEVEGCNLIPYDDKFLIEVDLFLERGHAFAKTEILNDNSKILWNESNGLSIGLEDVAHGSIIYVDDEETNEIIKALNINFTGSNLDDRNYNGKNITGDFENFVILPGYIYTITGNPTIQNLLNPFNLDLVSMKFATNVNNKLKIVNVGRDLQHMTKRDITLSNSAGINEQTFLLDLRWGYHNTTLPIIKSYDASQYWQNPNGLELVEATVKIHGTSGLVILAVKATSSINGQWSNLLSLPDNLLKPIQGGMISGDRKNIYQMNANNVQASITLSSGVTEVVRIPFIA